ncbi:hypothetical protein [Streptomyces sp. ID05-04B]|uniref:hypothetical protein n=1 Tax=Streptomyces sp. ID05-04B TaxID=3028661 RepID=UPI0029CA8E4C|nr:hypothetical protein [Streptomyces sp. ID05-04B]
MASTYVGASATGVFPGARRAAVCGVPSADGLMGRHGRVGAAASHTGGTRPPAQGAEESRSLLRFAAPRSAPRLMLR